MSKQSDDSIMICKARSVQTLDDLVEAIKNIITNAWDETVRAAATKALSSIEQVSGPITKEELAVLNDEVSQTLGQPLSSADKLALSEVSTGAYMSGVILGTGNAVKGAFGLPDRKALSVIDDNLFFWVNSYYDDNVQEAFRAALQDYFTGGYTRTQLATLLETQFGGMVSKSESYWDLLADHITTKTREIGRLSGYEQAGIEVVRIKAEIDDRTTRVCLRLHGQVISVTDLRRNVDRYLEACQTKDKDKIKSSWPWLSGKQADKKLSTQRGVKRAVKSGDVGLPPYHARCRTITVAEFFADAWSRVLKKGEKDEIERLLLM